MSDDAETSFKDGVDSLESLGDEIDTIVSQDVVEWTSSERLITLMIVVEQYRRSHVEFINDHSSLLLLEEETEKEAVLSPSQQEDLCNILRGDPTMRSFFVEAVLTIASWHVFLTWTNPEVTMRHFWILFNEYFRPSEMQSVYASEYYQKLSEKEVEEYLRPALKRTVETVRESYDFAMKTLRNSDQKVLKGIQDVFSSEEFKVDYMPEFKAHLKADDLPSFIRLYIDTVCNNAAVIQKVIEGWDSL